MKFNRMWKRFSVESLDFLLQRDMVRKIALKKAEEALYRNYVEINEENRPVRIQEGRCLMLKNLLRTVNKALENGRIAPGVRKALIGNFIGGVILNEEDRTASFVKEHGFFPPALLTISPTKKCNLMCRGCYAASSSGNAETLDYEILMRILKEKKDLWGSRFNVISGGEPLLYRSQGKTLFNLLEDNPDNYFMMYTNGTLITAEVARRMAELGNITPAISVEGFENETDGRRGQGVFKKIMQAFDNLGNAGVPFGVSITATRNNAELIMAPEFLDFYFREKGAIYGWIFQYMPIGRSFTIDLMITPEQRRELFRREQKIIKEFNLFMVDFWNGGPYAVGCISAGRPGGYFYIDWNGNVAPCTFFPYFVSNIKDIYRDGKTLNDVLFSPYFESVRAWQNEYGYGQPPEKVKNFIVPCIIRDHYEKAYSLIREFGAKPMDENAAEALRDPEYRKKMADYGKKTDLLTRELWETEFMNGCCGKKAKSAVR